MHDALTDVAGIAVGHATDEEALTGCTAVVCPDGAVAGVAVRGGAPGTRETDVCRPGTLIERVHAVLLTGGSAYGLEAAAGVMRVLREQGAGYDARGILVPIVPAAVIFDLALGSATWPDAEDGARAAAATAAGPVEQGCVGAGTGATVGKLNGMERATKSGLGTAAIQSGDDVVAAIAVVNAGGDVVDPDTGAIVAGARAADEETWADSVALVRAGRGRPPSAVESTTLAVVATSAGLSVEQCTHLAGVAHDGLARTIRPVHTLHDGDTIFALATGEQSRVPVEHLSHLAVLAVDALERAVGRAVTHARPAGGLPNARLIDT